MLTSKQKQFLKSKAVAIDAVIQIGKEGLTPAVLAIAKDALWARELIKVKINQNSPEDIQDVAGSLAEKLSGNLVQVIGKTCILFRKKEKNSHYELP